MKRAEVRQVLPGMWEVIEAVPDPEEWERHLPLSLHPSYEDHPENRNPHTGSGGPMIGTAVLRRALVSER